MKNYSEYYISITLKLAIVKKYICNCSIFFLEEQTPAVCILYDNLMAYKNNSSILKIS